MPIEIGIDSPNQTKIVKIQLKDKQGVYKIKIDQKPLKIILDPNLWVLMNSNFELPYQSKKQAGDTWFLKFKQCLKSNTV